MARVMLAKYGVAFTYPITLINAATGALAVVTTDYTQAAGDMQVSKDFGAFANATFNMTALAGTNGTAWNHVLSATEMQAKIIQVIISDAAPKAILDDIYIIQTYGHASASIVTDLSNANLFADIKAIDGDTTALTNCKNFWLGNVVAGTAQAGGASTITLASGSSATDDNYANGTIAIVAGTGAGQTPRKISSYVGASKIATVATPWTTVPDNTSVYQIIGLSQ